MSEHDHQAALFAMIDLHSERYPELKNIFAIPNGGARTARTGAMLKAEGVRRGVPDVFVAMPRHAVEEMEWSEFLGADIAAKVAGIPLGSLTVSHSSAGLFIEMKYGRNKPDALQDEWLGRLTKAGYRVVVCYSWEDAWKTICDYLGIDTT